MKLRDLRLLLLMFLAALPAYAHLGSKDVFEQLTAGPYKLFVTVRMPTVIPGIATVEVRASALNDATIDSIHITPMPLTGEASTHPPTPDAMKRSGDDPRFFTGSLWLMAGGSWQVRFQVTGSAGTAMASVPVAAMPLAVLKMNRPLGILLATLGLVLAIGFAGIVGAAVRESHLQPGTQPSLARRHRALYATAYAFAFIILVIVLANHWWNVEATDFASEIYHPLDMHWSRIGNTLDLSVSDQHGKDSKPSILDMTTLLLDHGKIMHLYAIRQPEMDAAFHLHPSASSQHDLKLTLPAMPPGTYNLYADIVLHNGFPETLTSTLTVPPNVSTAPLASDDASALPPPLAQGDLGPEYQFPDGYTMVWDRPAALTANTATLFRFRLLDPSGRPATDTVPYLSMAGHAAFIKTDGTVFAHTHPEGSVAMPAVMLANLQPPAPMADMPGMTSDKIPPVVAFPYGFPSPGRYRIFIQMKHGATVETGVFDAEVR